MRGQVAPRRRAALFALLCATGAASAALPVPQDRAYPGLLTVQVDVHDVQRHVVHVEETLTAPPADLVLYYPKWTPGSHAPSGPIDRMAGLEIRANGTAVRWWRDPLDVYAVHVEVPDGAAALDIRFDYLSPTSARIGPLEMSAEVLSLEWIETLLYPLGYYASRIPVDGSVRLPAGWDYATALSTATNDAGTVHFARTTLESFIDSPLYAGRYVRHIDLDPGAPLRVTLNAFADRPASLDVPESELKVHRALVQQAYRLYGSQHYAHYDFLLALTDRIQQVGIEHHQSSENGEDAEYFTDREATIEGRDLLAHEYTHSWNGKFRRPADLWTPSYDVPMQNSLLWVYEGQTQYWGQVLATRAGLWTAQELRDELATVAAFYQEQAGRRWRPLADTTMDEVMNERRPESWPSWQRFEEYYAEAQLIWLDADTLIRERSAGQRSLDDFARQFFGVENGRVAPLTYTFEDVVAALDRVQPYDWATFLRERVRDVRTQAPLDGLARGGYRLEYSDEDNAYLKAADKHKHRLTLTSSLGIILDTEDGTLQEVSWGSAAYDAGLAEGMQIVAANGERFDEDRFLDAVKAAHGDSRPIELIVRDADHYRVLALDYHGGLRFPHLVRVKGQPALLDSILKPRTS